MIPYHSLRRPAQLRNWTQAGIHVGRRRPDALLYGLVCLGRQSLAAVDAVDLGLLTASYPQSDTSLYIENISVIAIFITIC